MYVYYNPNPDRILVGDCVVRALCRLLRNRWLEVYEMICAQGAIMYDMPSSNVVWGACLKRLGFVKQMLPDYCPDCYTVRDFCREHPFGQYVLMLDGHVVAVEDGNYYDTWDSGDEVPCFFWRKEQ